MSNNPNKLASKHTPGPWNVKLTEKMISIHTGSTDEDKDGIDPTICGIWAAQFDDDRRPESEANAHLISAAPEAIEFIANIVHMMSESNFPQACKDSFIKTGEEILKKAYNL